MTPSMVWAAIAASVILLIVYGIISSRLAQRRQRAQHEKFLPSVPDCLRADAVYNVYFNDGRKFFGVRIVGMVDASEGPAVFGGYEGLMVLRKEDGKRLFVRQSALRCIEEV